jgi:hypothetical protein
MIKERRKSHRRAISRIAKIQVANDALARECVVTDISEGGVRLHVQGIDVPEAFVLLFDDGTGTRPRDCTVVWRLGYELGAKFGGMLSRSVKAKEYATP